MDTSLTLDLVEDNARAEAFRQDSAGQDREWCASPLVRMESLVRALKENDTPVLLRIEEALGAMVSLPLTDDVFDLAARLHAATTLAHGCAELWTADARLARALIAGLQIRLVAG